MALKHTWTTAIKNDAGVAVTTDTPQVFTGESEENFYVDVAASATVIVEIAVAVDDIVSGFLASDKDVDVKTNAVDATGGQTINLTANKAFAWNNTMGFANPFTPTITKFYCHNAGLTLAKVRGGFLINHT